MLEFFKTIIYQPLYNLLITIIDVIPGGDVGLAVITITLLVRFVLFPLSKKSIVTQQKIKKYQEELNKIKEKYKKDRQKQAEMMLAFYKEKGINPFSSIFLMLIQIPIIISLYLIFLHTALPAVEVELLYTFIPEPDVLSMNFMGFIDISSRSWGLALLAGFVSFFQMQLSLPEIKKVDKPSFKDDLARSMNVQMRYIFPIIIFIIAYMFSAVVALYLFTSNLFAVGQELLVKRRIKIED